MDLLNEICFDIIRFKMEVKTIVVTLCNYENFC